MTEEAKTQVFDPAVFDAQIRPNELEVVLPSGMRGVLGKLRGFDAGLLTNRQKRMTGEADEEVLATRWLKTLDPGPYDGTGVLGKDGKVDWRRALQGDRFAVLMLSRCLAYGPIYKCIAAPCDVCGRDMPIEVNVIRDSWVQRLSPESATAFRAGNKLEFGPLPSTGRRVWFELATGETERKVSGLLKDNPDQPLFAVMRARVVEVEGVSPHELNEFLLYLPEDDGSALRAHFDAVDCGIETTVQAQCPFPMCGAQNERTIPFARDFFSGSGSASKACRPTRTKGLFST